MERDRRQPALLEVQRARAVCRAPRAEPVSPSHPVGAAQSGRDRAEVLAGDARQVFEGDSVAHAADVYIAT